MSSAAAVGLTGVTELRVHNFSVSLDGYAAGPDQNEANPLGTGGELLHDWVFSPGATDVDRRFLALGEQGIGATIMGRNMFGPVRGDWDTAGEWRGWWSEDPPFHHDVFVLTHHARPPLTMAGGTTFHFVSDGIEAALERTRVAADGQDVRLGGGASTVQEYLRAGPLDELHLAVVPVLLGSGERLFEDLGTAVEGWTCVEFAPSAAVTHVRLRRGSAAFDTGSAVFDTMGA
jgi:dihydrofolate reductase